MMDPKQYRKMPLLPPQEEVDFLASFKAYKKGGCEGTEPKIKKGFRLSKQGNHDYFKLVMVLPGEDPDRTKRMTNAQALKLDAKRRREKVAEERLIIHRAVDNFIAGMPVVTESGQYVLIDVRLMFESIPNMRKMDSKMAEIQSAMRERMDHLNCARDKGKWYTTQHTRHPDKMPDYIPAEELY